MLIRYKKSFGKFAMGLLAFMPSEKDIKKLQNTLKMYEEEESKQLFLWKDEDIIGLIGISVDADKKLVIHHLAVNPSYRHQGIGKKMIHSLMEQYAGYSIEAAPEIKPFFSRCSESESGSCESDEEIPKKADH